MKLQRILVCVTFGLLVATVQQGFAQSVSHLIPPVVVKDVDGKVVAQVADLSGSDGRPLVVLNVEGELAILAVWWYGLEDDRNPSSGVSYDSVDCTGNAYISPPHGMLGSSSTNFSVAGPDPILGSYKLYRTTGAEPESFWCLSEWSFPRCKERDEERILAPAEEVIPNPLEGFHGRTDAEPILTWTMEGGDIIIPSPTPAPTTTPPL